jgi:hypothetical protein
MPRIQRVLIAVTLGALVCAPVAGAQGGRGMGMGPMAMGHDSATRSQMQVIHELVVNNAKITRTVTHLPNGIRTVTESADPQLAKLIREHVVTMDGRVVNKDDPMLPMESSALRAIYAAGDKIRTTIDTTPTGIIIVQTSADSVIVAALQTHAAEVSDLVQRGMAAMHEAMMRRRP